MRKGDLFMKMKRILSLGMAAAMLLIVAVGCGDNASSASSGSDGSTASTSTKGGTSGSITVVSREDGSGTRGAFIELFGIESKDADGNAVDNTTATAEITNSTAVMITNITGNVNAIGYISLGSMSDDVTAVEIDGAAATADNVKNGTYKVSRPFNIATKDDLSEVGQDFINFILSEDGQAVVEEAGYISDGNTGAYEASGQSGKITVAGSSSVTPVMEKLKEAYVKLNPDVTVEVQQSDSTTGMTSLAEGVCDIGMASRELKDSELEKGLNPTVIAIDGIAVIVNNDSGITGLTSEQVKDIFTGAVTDWSEIQ